MRRLPRSLCIPVAAAAAVLLLAACGGSSQLSSSSATTTSAVNIASGTGGGVCPYKFAVITHGDNGKLLERRLQGRQERR